MKILLSFLMYISLVSQVNADIKYEKIYNKCVNYKPSKKIITQQLSSTINYSTSRFLKTKMMCRIATENCLKPLLLHKDNLMVSTHRYTFAEMNDDNIPELITGAIDETYLHNNPIFPPGNKERATKGLQYYFFSNDPQFIIPKDTKFIGVSNFIVNDFNQDGRDDVFFVHHGPDVGRSPQKNKILLSNTNGYKVLSAPGSKSLWHGGTSGDIDNDGDIDVIVTPGPSNEIVLYRNNGDGRFSYSTLFSNLGRYSHIELWDIDKDGNLDILMDGHKTDLLISWGKGKGQFSTPSILFNTPNSVVHELGFADIDNDNNEEIILLSSLSTKFTKTKYNYSMYYGGFEISYLKIKDKKIISKKIITKHINPKGFHVWLDGFSTCDIKNDGIIDLVWEKIGEGNYFPELAYSGNHNYDWSKTGKLVWFNDGNANFELKRFEDPMYFFGNSIKNYNYKENTKYIENLFDHAKKNGIALNKYLPHKIYHKSDDEELFIRNTRNIKPYPFEPLKIK